MVYGSGSKKKKPEKKMNGKSCSTCGETQHNIPKRVKEYQKVKHNEVFSDNKGKQKKSNKKKY